MVRYLFLLSLFCVSFPLLANHFEDPESTLLQWLEEEKTNSKNPHLYATLATVDVSNKPFTRLVQFDWTPEEGVVFYTHRNTQKVVHLSHQKAVSLNPWLGKTRRQISLEGQAKALPADKLEATWKTMPRWMQLRFIASDHKSVLANKDVLTQNVEKIRTQYPEEIPMPQTFVGYRIDPEQITFYALKTPDFAQKHIAKKVDNAWQVAQYQP